MYRLLVETLLGLNRTGDHLILKPHLPHDWNECTLHYRFHDTVCHIHVSRPSHSSVSGGVLTLDGQELPGVVLPLKNDRREHVVHLVLGNATSRIDPVSDTPPMGEILQGPVTVGSEVNGTVPRPDPRVTSP